MKEPRGQLLNCPKNRRLLARLRNHPECAASTTHRKVSIALVVEVESSVIGIPRNRWFELNPCLNPI